MPSSSRRVSLLLAALGARWGPVLASAGVAGDLAEQAVGREAEIDAHTGNHCHDEKDGSHCYDDGVLFCQGRFTQSYTKCRVTEECKHGMCQEDTCTGKPDGRRCHDGHVVECSGGRGADVETCGEFQDCQFGACVDKCAGKADGSYCKDNHIMQCEGQTSTTTPCEMWQKCKETPFMPGSNSAPTATCVEDVCVGKMGTFCKDGGVVECQNGVGQSFSKCAFYQECSGRSGAEQCTEDACEDKSDGWHCKGDHRVRCQGRVTAEFEICQAHTECHREGAEPTCGTGPSSSAGTAAASAAVLVAAAVASFCAL